MSGGRSFGTLSRPKDGEENKQFTLKETLNSTFLRSIYLSVNIISRPHFLKKLMKTYLKVFLSLSIQREFHFAMSNQNLFIQIFIMLFSENVSDL